MQPLGPQFDRFSVYSQERAKVSSKEQDAVYLANALLPATAIPPQRGLGLVTDKLGLFQRKSRQQSAVATYEVAGEDGQTHAMTAYLVKIEDGSILFTRQLRRDPSNEHGDYVVSGSPEPRATLQFVGRDHRPLVQPFGQDGFPLDPGLLPLAERASFVDAVTDTLRAIQNVTPVAQTSAS